MVMTELDDDNAASAAAGIDDDGDDKVDLVSGTQSPTALQHSGICIIGVLRPVNQCGYIRAINIPVEMQEEEEKDERKKVK